MVHVLTVNMISVWCSSRTSNRHCIGWEVSLFSSRLYSVGEYITLSSIDSLTNLYMLH